MKLPPYVLVPINDEECIIKLSYPGFIGKVVKTEKAIELLSYSDCQAVAASDAVAGYNILIDFYSSIMDNKVLISGWSNIQVEMNRMAIWYLTDVIGKRLPEFERFRM